jgi:hypothetical protein
MQYLIVHVCVGDHILDRNVFFDPKEAHTFARRQLSEKVWRVNECVYFGDVSVNIYEVDMTDTSDIEY